MWLYANQPAERNQIPNWAIGLDRNKELIVQFILTFPWNALTDEQLLDIVVQAARGEYQQR